MSQKRQNDEGLSQQEKKSKLNSTAMEESSFYFPEANLEYVIMPWDDNTELIFYEPDSQGETVGKLITRWELIQLQLHERKPIYDIQMFIDVIKSYNVAYNKDGKQIKPLWKCMILRHLINSLEDDVRDAFFGENGLLNRIRHLALNLKEVMPKLRLLKSGTRMFHTLHQMQIASLLANAFMCTFPKREADCPSINFITLFEGGGGNRVADFYVEKLNCIINYFRRITSKEPTGKVTFQRLCIPDNKFPRWDKTKAELCHLQVETEGRIEEQEGYLQMDFANKYVGGGVLGRGCVQEEIRFIICPELIVARLFTECLADNEALLVTGAERYCSYEGYSDSFEYRGDYKDDTPVDDTGHRKTYLIVLDALYFQNPFDQYRQSKILRELKKAYVGFKPIDEKNTLPIATGNWGCGAFRGDPQLKSVIQLMAASQARRNMLYLTFGDVELKNQMEDLYIFLQNHGINVGDLYRIVREYKYKRVKNQTVYEFIKEAIDHPKPLQSHQTPSASTSTIPWDLFVKKEPSKKFESDELLEDEFAVAEKTSAFKIKNDIARTKKSKPIEKHFQELEMDYDISEKRIKRQSSSPSDTTPGLITLGEEDKKLLAMYMRHPLPEKKNVPKPSVWFENEITSHTTKKTEKLCESKSEQNLTDSSASSLNANTQFSALEKMSIDNSVEEKVSEEMFLPKETCEEQSTLRSPSPSLITSSLEQHYKDESFSEKTFLNSELTGGNSSEILDDSLENNSSNEFKNSEKNCDGEELVIKEPVNPERCVQTDKKATDKKYSQIKITDFFFKK